MTLIDDIIKQLNLDTIPIRYPVVPYEDLVAEDTYGRRLLIPDDIPPTLSAMSFKGPTKPRLATGTDDGALNVNIHATEVPIGGAGGSGITPVKMYHDRGESVSTGSVGGPADVKSLSHDLNVLYGVQVAWYYHFTPGNAIPNGNLRFYISDESETTVFQVGRFAASRNDFTADNAPPWIGAEQVTMFPIPVDGTTWTTKAGLILKVNGDLANVFVSGTVFYA